MTKIDIISGARPNFMKIAPIIRAIDNSERGGNKQLKYRLVHTGQHYDARLSGDLFNQLGIPEPDVNMKVGSGSQAKQTAAIMVCYEELLLESRTDLCLVVGDVTSAMACAISAQKLCVPVAHIEGGIRSGDWNMPEEINRLITDSITNWFFTTSEAANYNLKKAGVSDDRIFFVGNTMIDTLLVNKELLEPPSFWDVMNLQAREYFVLTLHRPSNVDKKNHFQRVLQVISQGAREFPVVFPVHPRTSEMLREYEGIPDNIIIVKPQRYLQFNYLVKHAKGVITDSGGVSEETTVMGVPCLTLRDTTERPETVKLGTNELLGTNPLAIVPAMNRVISGQWKRGTIPDKWDGKAAERIVYKLRELLINKT